MSAVDRFAHDDGAYVLGALSAADRSAFEAHLSGCVDCMRRVSEVATLPALLAGLSASDFEPAIAQGSVPETLLPSLLRAVGRQRRRRRGLLGVLAGVAAACLIALGLVIAWPNGAPAGETRVMTAVLASPVHATATLSTASWGTRIQLACRYDVRYSDHVSASAYSLVVIDRQGESYGTGSWTLTSGGVTHFTSGTALRRDQIAKIEVTVGTTPILQLVP